MVCAWGAETVNITSAANITANRTSDRLTSPPPGPPNAANAGGVYAGILVNVKDRAEIRR